MGLNLQKPISHIVGGPLYVQYDVATHSINALQEKTLSILRPKRNAQNSWVR